MTTKEEVLKLAEMAGVTFFEPSDGKPILILSGGNYTKEIITLIELAKQAEREECAKLCESKIICTNPSALVAHDVAIMKCARAIRNRESKS